MNRKTQIITLSILGGTLGLSLLANYWLAIRPDRSEALNALDGLLRKKKLEPISKTALLPKEKEAITKASEKIPYKEVEQTIESVQNDDFPLRYSSKGPRVHRLQVWLLRNYGWTGEVTDILDKKTEAQMKKYLKTDALDQATYNRLKLEAPIHQQKFIR